MWGISQKIQILLWQRPWRLWVQRKPVQNSELDPTHQSWYKWNCDWSPILKMKINENMNILPILEIFALLPNPQRWQFIHGNFCTFVWESRFLSTFFKISVESLDIFRSGFTKPTLTKIISLSLLVFGQLVSLFLQQKGQPNQKLDKTTDDLAGKKMESYRTVQKNEALEIKKNALFRSQLLFSVTHTVTKLKRKVQKF